MRLRKSRKIGNSTDGIEAKAPIISQKSIALVLSVVQNLQRIPKGASLRPRISVFTHLSAYGRSLKFGISFPCLKANEFI